jgi:hypothetical protein
VLNEANHFNDIEIVATKGILALHTIGVEFLQRIFDVHFLLIILIDNQQ